MGRAVINLRGVKPDVCFGRRILELNTLFRVHLHSEFHILWSRDKLENMQTSGQAPWRLTQQSDGHSAGIVIRGMVRPVRKRRSNVLRQVVHFEK